MGFMLTDDVHDELRWRLYLGFPIILLGCRITGLKYIFPFDSVERHMQLNQMDKLQQFCKMMYKDGSPEQVQTLVASKVREDKLQTYPSTFRTRLLIALVVIASNQLTGINGILYYAKQLFSKVTGGKEEYSQVLIMQLSLLQVVSTLISTEIVDKVGRRRMLLTGQTLIALILLGISLLDLLGGKSGELGVLFLLFAHILVMNMTLGPVCIVYCTEILTDISWVILTLKGCALGIALTTQYMIEYWGLGFMFLLFFGLTLLCLLFLAPRLKETAGRSRDQVYRSFGASSKVPSVESAALIHNQE